MARPAATRLLVAAPCRIASRRETSRSVISGSIAPRIVSLVSMMCFAAPVVVARSGSGGRRRIRRRGGDRGRGADRNARGDEARGGNAREHGGGLELHVQPLCA